MQRFLEVDDAEKTVGFEGKNLEIAPNRRLVFTWSKVIADTSGECETAAASQVEVNFTAKDNSTDVRLVHFAVRDDAIRQAFGGGWAFAFTTTSALLGR